MSTICTFVLSVIVCTLSPEQAADRSPEKAAAILAPRQYVHVVSPPTSGPTVTIFAGSPTDGPFGPVTLRPRPVVHEVHVGHVAPWATTWNPFGPFLSVPFVPPTRPVRQGGKR